MPSIRSSCDCGVGRLHSMRVFQSAFVGSVSCMPCPALCHLLRHKCLDIKCGCNLPGKPRMITCLLIKLTPKGVVFSFCPPLWMQCEWLQFTGHIKLPTTGFWSFSLSSDDSSLLYIDGALFINNDGMQLKFKYMLFVMPALTAVAAWHRVL